MLLLFIELSTSFSWCSLPTNIRTLLLLYSSGYWRFPVFIMSCKLGCGAGTQLPDGKSPCHCWVSPAPPGSRWSLLSKHSSLFHSAWHRWCVVMHLATLPVNLTRHLVSCPLQIPTWLTFFLITSKLPSWASSHLDRSPLASWIVLGFPSMIWWHFLSVFSWDIHL